MDHRDVIASLTNEERSRLTGKSDLPGIIQFAVHLGAIVALGALIAAKVPYWPVLMLPQGILIVFLFTL
ncbi:MAG: fatty acid desaturase, partial [Mesorhizobium sp.]